MHVLKGAGDHCDYLMASVCVEIEVTLAASLVSLALTLMKDV